MSDEDKNKMSGDGQKKPSGNFQFPVSTWIVWILIIGSIVGLALLHNHINTPTNQITENEFFQKVDANLIAKGTIDYAPQSAYPNATFNDITGTYYKADKDGEIIKENGKPVEVPFSVSQVLLTQGRLDKLLASQKFVPVQQNTVLFTLLLNIAPFLLIGVLFWFFFIRQIKMAGKGALSFGKSKAKMLAKDQ
jgi:cell division protease FtsH